MKLLVRTAVGFAVFAGGLTFLAYGLAQLIEIGSCGTDEYGRSVGPPCPSGFGPMILLMVFGAFAAFAGVVVASSRSGALGGMLRFFGALLVAGIAGAVLGFVDLHPDDSRPGLEIVIAAAGAVLLVFLPRGRRIAVAPAPVVTAPRAANAEDVAARLRQLDQLRESGLLEPDEYAKQRKQILAEE